MLISQVLGVPYRDKGTMMTGFKDWLTQISGAICHAPTGRRRRRRSVATPAHLHRRCFCLASPLLWDASSVPYQPAGSLLSSARQTPLNSKVNCEIGIFRGKRSPNSSNPPTINFPRRCKIRIRKDDKKNWYIISMKLGSNVKCLYDSSPMILRFLDKIQAVDIFRIEIKYKSANKLKFSIIYDIVIINLSCNKVPGNILHNFF